MVAFEATAPDSGEVTLAVLATPGSCERSVAETLEVRRLSSWGREQNEESPGRHGGKDKGTERRGDGE
jgi:hypothetical protein